MTSRSAPTLTFLTTKRSTLPRGLWWLYAGLALLLTFVHAYTVNLPGGNERLRRGRHQEIVELRGKAPYGYRLLVPVVIETAHARLIAAGMAERPARESGYLVVRFAATFAAILLFHAFLRGWYEPAWAVAGTLLFVALHPPSYLHYWFQPASSVDLVAWLVAARLAQRHASAWWLVPLVAIGAFNRETVVFAPLVYLALRTPRAWSVAGLAPVATAFACWALVFVALRWWIVGDQPAVVTPWQVMRENVGHPSWYAYAGAFFGAMWVLPAARWREAPAELRALALVLVPYLGLQLVFGRVREVRLLLPLSLLLVPYALDYLRATTRLDGGTAAEGARARCG